jgi:hypothetical protein
MPRRAEIAVPLELQPLLARPPDWAPREAWRAVAAACRASGYVAWAARLQPPGGPSFWLTGLARSRPRVVQSECVEALAAALERVPRGAAVEVICPTSLRYLVQGRDFAPGTPERRLAELAAGRRLWARYALGELEALADACLARAYTVLEPVRWPGEAALQPPGGGPAGAPYVLYGDGGCARGVCAAAWVLRQDGCTRRERCWTLEAPAERDAVRLAEFTAVADGLRALPEGVAVAVVNDHVDVADFGVHGVPAFAPGRRVARVLDELRACAGARRVRWYWAERAETEGQRRCQALIQRRLRATHARERFLAACAQARMRRVYLPDFARWLAPRGPAPSARRAWPGAHEEWAAAFEHAESFLATGPPGPRLYLRQLTLDAAAHPGLAAAFETSVIARWCVELGRRAPLANSAATYVGRLRSGFAVVALLFEPRTALLVQPRPGAELAHALDAAATVAEAPAQDLAPFR